MTIGEVAALTGVATSKLRFYEQRDLLHPLRTAGGQRRYHRDAVCRVSFIVVCRQGGFTIDEIATAMAALPTDRPASGADWRRLAGSLKPVLDDRIDELASLSQFDTWMESS